MTSIPVGDTIILSLNKMSFRCSYLLCRFECVWMCFTRRLYGAGAAYSAGETGKMIYLIRLVLLEVATGLF
jgi:hypothetical protein